MRAATTSRAWLKKVYQGPSGSDECTDVYAVERVGEAQDMKADDHTKSIGAIVTNLQALETVIRYFLLRVNRQVPDFPEPGAKDTSITYLTDYRSLRSLITSYNDKLTDAEARYAVDLEAVIKIRDALAHGRLVTTSELPATLWKFGEPVNGRVPIEFCEVMTLDYMTKTWKMIHRERGKVADCFNARGYEGLR